MHLQMLIYCMYSGFCTCKRGMDVGKVLCKCVILRYSKIHVKQGSVCVSAGHNQRWWCR